MLRFFMPSIPRVSIPPELDNETALFTYLGISAQEMKKIWWYRDKMYNSFVISKGNSKLRVINAPNDRLKYLQYKIYPLLKQLYRVRNPVHGFVENKSIKTNALAHLGRRFILNIDIKSFFPSITEKRVAGVFKSLGLDNKVANIIARICCYKGYLPQGAPTSPLISNMICFRLDKSLLLFAKKTRCIYTRYADDITLSSYQPVTALFQDTTPSAGHFSPLLLSTELQDIVKNNGFEINPDKAHYADRNSRRMVTGLKVNELLNVDRRYIRNIKAALLSIKMSGETAAQKKFQDEYSGSANLKAHLHGKITWLRHIRGQSDPIVRKLAIQYNAVFPEEKIQITPSKTEIRERAVWVVELLNNLANRQLQSSAFFLKDVGLVTAAHCVADLEEVLVYHPSKPSNKFMAKIKFIDKHRDLAILDHNIPITEYFELEPSSQAVEISCELMAVGYPSFGPGDGLNVRSGTVSSLPIKSGVQFIEVTQQLAQGMSGGPLLADDLAVAGIIHKGGPSEGRNFAIHLKELYIWLAN